MLIQVGVCLLDVLNEHAKPVSNMVEATHFVTTRLKHPTDGLANNGRPEVTNMHVLRDVGDEESTTTRFRYLLAEPCLTSEAMLARSRRFAGKPKLRFRKSSAGSSGYLASVSPERKPRSPETPFESNGGVSGALRNQAGPPFSSQPFAGFRIAARRLGAW